ncbi:MAG: tetratricopeptide repeat protein, partial [Terriglobales bacterium]
MLVIKYTRAAETFEKQNKPQNAIKDYSEAIKLEPDNADLYVHRGNLHIATAAYEKAIEDFSDAIKHDPQDTENFRKRALCYV